MPANNTAVQKRERSETHLFWNHLTDAGPFLLGTLLALLLAWAGFF